MMAEDYLLKIESVSKSFPGVKALDNVSFNIRRGAVHALIGENGAGKSTLIKILAGIYKKDSGTITLDGKEVAFKEPVESRDAGISVVHQELKLADPLTVTENIFLGNLIYNKYGLVDWATMKEKAREMIRNLGIDIDVDLLVRSLSVAQQQMVEICKAVNQNAKLLIMDEPSAVLMSREQELMFDVIRRLKKEGITFIYISHRLEEIFNLADDVTVLRDGKVIDTVPVSETDKNRLVTMMVGRELANDYPKEEVEIGDVVLDVKNINRPGVIENISFNLHEGEIIGFAGLVGSGRTEVMRALLGIDKAQVERITYKGKEVKHKSFMDAIRNGFGMIPEDRKNQGLVQILSVLENTSMVSLHKFVHSGMINHKEMRQATEQYVKEVGVKTPSMETEVQYLSGGNQQKVVVAKWLMEQCSVYILDEPTRGIDIGAKNEIYKLITELVKQKNSVIMVSSEMPELLGMCDRIYVMHEGHLVGELNRDEATQEAIMSLCI